jgi:sugar phosphate isomerase/epimerase
MLLTLAVSSLKTLLRKDAADAGGRLAPLDVPMFARRELGLHGLNVPAWLLSGWTVAELERLRDVADKAACPCLILVDDEALDLGAASAPARQGALERFSKLTTAASRLGCNALAISCKGPAAASEQCFERTVEAMKATFGVIDRLELNVLIRPSSGMLDDPTRLTELIKRVGGFRIGSLPDFGHARKSKEPALTLRKLAPYAGAIHATIEGFGADGRHSGCDLAACVEAIQSVGYQNTLAIEYVGKPDAVAAILKARDLLIHAISGEDPTAAPDEEGPTAEGPDEQGDAGGPEEGGTEDQTEEREDE